MLLVGAFAATFVTNILSGIIQGILGGGIIATIIGLVFSLANLALYVFIAIQLWKMLKELKAFRQKDDINPILFYVPILSIIEMWKLGPKVLEAKQLAGVQNAQVVHNVLYLFFGAIYFLPKDLNEIWQAAGGGRRSVG